MTKASEILPVYSNTLRGCLGADGPVCKYIPAFVAERDKYLTLVMLLSCRLGFPERTFPSRHSLKKIDNSNRRKGRKPAVACLRDVQVMGKIMSEN